MAEENTHYVVMSARFSGKWADKIVQYCKDNSMSKSEFIRIAVREFMRDKKE